MDTNTQLPKTYVILESITEYGENHTYREINPDTMEIPYWGKPDKNGVWLDPKSTTQRNRFKQYKCFVKGKSNAKRIVQVKKQLTEMLGIPLLPTNF